MGKLVRVNKGFLIAFNRYKAEALCELLGRCEKSIYNVRNGKTRLSIDDAAKLHDQLGIGWVNFKQYEDVLPAGMMRGEK